MQTRIPCVLMRGGTSRGPFFLSAHLPADPAARDAVLLAALGSPHPMQVDGIGGGTTLTSKVAIVGPSTEPGVDVDYLFAQVAVERNSVDTRPNCGNMLAAVGPFAIEAGLVAPGHPQTLVRIRNRNTGQLVEAVVRTPGGQVTYTGETAIPGVPGTAAPIALRFRDVAGSKTGRLFPSGARSEAIGGVTVTLIDGAMPMMLVAAADLGTRADAPPEAIEADPALRARIEALRLEAGRRMGLGDVSDSVVPKPALLGPGTGGATLTARYLTPHSVHRAMAVTGGITLAVAARLPGTVAAALATPPARPEGGEDSISIAHPAGLMEIGLWLEEGKVRWASVQRTARRIFEGHLLLPEETARAVAMAAPPLLAAE
ncbi:4-oxalomesaconate tautomerase [Roseomonas sp. GC11]|uniref:4-oxalomesaconate tautomerase n=1 Tax=Roseomonas sp. GC11 TaxID=2950546 RepID=UPI00210928AB|nr:4-oxalomesaconate tautomerase [Roseomonas sp. GC11]MCQ4159261.1 4-oxalomesaconate tautomerase [Roseomonas sp. GC11]